MINWDNAPDWVTEVRSNGINNDLCWSNEKQYQYFDPYNLHVYHWEHVHDHNFGTLVERRPIVQKLDWKDAPSWATEIRNLTDGSGQIWANDEKYSKHSPNGPDYHMLMPGDDRFSTLDSLRPGSADIEHLVGEGILSPLNTQRGGDHYKKLGAYQPWEVLQKWMTPDELRGYMKGTVIGYLARERDKGGDLDIEKAFHSMELYHEVAKRYEE